MTSPAREKPRSRVPLAAGIVALALATSGGAGGMPPWVPVAARAGETDASFDASSEPAGATVLVDGKEIGKTPLRGARIPPGKHTIRIVLAEHEPFETTVEASPQGTSWLPTTKLVPWPALIVESLAADATVSIDGAAPAASGRVAPGPHVVTITRPGFAAQELEVRVPPGPAMTVKAADWASFQCRLDLSALPRDATAVLDGVPASGVLTWPAPRKGVLRLMRPGHFPRDVPLDIPLGASFTPPDAWVKLPPVAVARAKGVGDVMANSAVKAGLDWLVRHQSPDGRWDCDGFDTRCKGQACGGAGESVFDPGVTGLAVQAFVGAGQDHLDGPAAPAVAKALKYLGDIQDSDGCFGPRTSQSFQYNHACAATAVLDAYWMTNDRSLRDSAANGLRFTLASQNPYLAWRYGVRDGDNDTPTTIYQSIVVRTAEWTDLAPTPDWRAGVVSWLDKMTEPEFGKSGYQQRGGDPSRWTGMRGIPTRPSQRGPMGTQFDVSRDFPNTDSESLTAGTQLVRRLLAAEPNVFQGMDLDAAGAALVGKRRPFATGDWIDLHYALWGSLLHAQDAKAKLGNWRKETVAEVVARQFSAKYGCGAGSWEAAKDPFGAPGGRVYTTAMALLVLEAPNRFPVVPPAPKTPAKPAKPAKPGGK